MFHSPGFSQSPGILISGLAFENNDLSKFHPFTDMLETLSDSQRPRSCVDSNVHHQHKNDQRHYNTVILAKERMVTSYKLTAN